MKTRSVHSVVIMLALCGIALMALARATTGGTNEVVTSPDVAKAGVERTMKLADLWDGQPKDTTQAMIVALKAVDFPVRFAKVERTTKTTYELFLEDGFHFQAKVIVDIDKMSVSIRKRATE